MRASGPDHQQGGGRRGLRERVPRYGWPRWLTDQDQKGVNADFGQWDGIWSPPFLRVAPSTALVVVSLLRVRLGP